MDNSDSKNIEAVLGQGSCLVKTDNIQLAANINPMEG